MDTQTLANLGLVLLFVLVGGVFAGTELALVSLREGQLDQLEKDGYRVVEAWEDAEDIADLWRSRGIDVHVVG
jgi:putative hemolysin